MMNIHSVHRRRSPVLPLSAGRDCNRAVKRSRWCRGKVLVVLLSLAATLCVGLKPASHRPPGLAAAAPGRSPPVAAVVPDDDAPPALSKSRRRREERTRLAAERRRLNDGDSSNGRADRP
mmetsp:Transcript_36326/g.116384  ORF Transcript_36326/g.116384 Transcript_36326/m.116384 type:complete len:120 (+) Transcript_36326:1186-1545(+)